MTADRRLLMKLGASQPGGVVVRLAAVFSLPNLSAGAVDDCKQALMREAVRSDFIIRVCSWSLAFVGNAAMHHINGIDRQ